MSPKFFPTIIDVIATNRDKFFCLVNEKKNKKTPNEKKITAITIKIFDELSTLKPISNNNEDN